MHTATGGPNMQTRFPDATLALAGLVPLAKVSPPPPRGLAVYDSTVADTAVDFFAAHCRLTNAEWAGRPFVLRDWQSYIVRRAYGTLRPDGTRQYRRVIIWVPRKNGKSEFMGGVSHLELSGLGEMGGEGYCIAGSEDQARIVFKVASQMVAYSETLGECYEVLKDSIYCSALHSVLREISSRAGVSGTCWVSNETLARDTKLSLSQVKRVLKGLRQLSLIVEHTERVGRLTRHHKRVAFANLKDFVKEQRELFCEPEEVLTGQREVLTGQRGAVDRSTWRCLTGQQLATKIKGREIKDSIEGDGILENREKVVDAAISITERQQLADPECVQQLWLLTLRTYPQLFANNEFCRLRFFAWAAHCWKHWAALQNPAGFFVSLLRKGRDALAMQINDASDIPQAKRMLAELEGQVLVGSAQHQATALDADWHQDADQRRQELQRQAAALAALAERTEFSELTTEQLSRVRSGA
jgi:hypothetical protein